MANIQIEIDFKPGVSEETVITVAGLLKSRLIETFNNHSEYKYWLNTEFKMSIINERSITEQLPLFS